MIRPIAVTAVSVIFICAILAQDTATRPTFDVVSIKENKSGDTRVANNLGQPGGRFTATNFPLGLLIALVYQVPTPAERTGWPDWINSERYDIEAVADGSPSRDQKILMVQALLADRFRLVVHRDNQQLPVYALAVLRDGKLGPQLNPHTNDTKCRDPQSPPPAPPGPGAAAPMPICGGFNGTPAQGRLNGQKVTMAMLATFLSQPSGRYVIDRTGLNGAFDLTIQYERQQPGATPGPDPAAVDPSGPPSLFTALQEQLGLKLVPQTGPVPVLVIDRVEKPSEN